MTPRYWSNSESKISARGGASGSPSGGGTRCDELLEDVEHALAGLAARCAGSRRRPRRSARRPRAATRSGSAPGRSILFRHGMSSSPASTARYVLATVWASTPCEASTTSSAPSHALQRPRDLVGEVDVAGRVDEVELVGLAVAGGVEDAHRLGLDRDPALALELHRVEQLGAHEPRVDRLGQLEDAIGQRRLAVVDVGDDREVADVGGVGRAIERPTQDRSADPVAPRGLHRVERPVGAREHRRRRSRPCRGQRHADRHA